MDQLVKVFSDTYTNNLNQEGITADTCLTVTLDNVRWQVLRMLSQLYFSPWNF